MTYNVFCGTLNLAQSNPIKFTVPHKQVPDALCVQASVFFALPGGSGLEYSLSGTSEPPKPINKIARDVPCKTEYTEPLTVDNWLSKPQRSDNTHTLQLPVTVTCSTNLQQALKHLLIQINLI